MLLKIKKVKTEEETVELKLPAFYRKDDQYYMINENETLLQIADPVYGAYVSTWPKESPFCATRIAEVLSYEPISPYVFFKILESFKDHLKANVENLLLTK